MSCFRRTDSEAKVISSLGYRTISEIIALKTNNSMLARERCSKLTARERSWTQHNDAIGVGKEERVGSAFVRMRTPKRPATFVREFYATVER